MKTPLHTLAVVVLLAALPAPARQQPSPAKTLPDSINYMWKMVERDFTSLAEAMPEDKWNFKPTQGAFIDVRTFGEQVKHVACANEAWAKKLRGEAPPDHCDTGGPSPAKTKSEILVYLHERRVTATRRRAAMNRCARDWWSWRGRRLASGIGGCMFAGPLGRACEPQARASSVSRSRTDDSSKEAGALCAGGKAAGGADFGEPGVGARFPA